MTFSVVLAPVMAYHVATSKSIHIHQLVAAIPGAIVPAPLRVAVEADVGHAVTTALVLTNVQAKAAVSSVPAAQEGHAALDPVLVSYVLKVVEAVVEAVRLHLDSTPLAVTSAPIWTNA